MDSILCLNCENFSFGDCKCNLGLKLNNNKCKFFDDKKLYM